MNNVKKTLVLGTSSVLALSGIGGGVAMAMTQPDDQREVAAATQIEEKNA